MTLDVHFGFNEKGEPVSIPLFQMFFDATTGHGKTIGMKTLLWRFHLSFPDWKILIIDSKDKRDYADFNADIPICFVQTTEPLDLKNLLEPLVGSSMMYYLDKIIEEAIFDTLGEMQKNIEKKITRADKGKIKIHGKELGKLRVLNHLLKKLIVLVERPEITDELVLRPGLNVMPVSLPGVPARLKRAYQWLIVRSVMLKLTEPQHEKVLVVLDEFHKWSPQRWASIVKQAISENVSEGRGKQQFYWMADQALAKVDKEPLKPVKVWIVGQQLGRHEVKYAIETVNDMTELTMDKKDIKRLHVGHFIILDGVNHHVEKAYLQPCGVPDELAKQIATGERSPLDADPYISEFKFVSRVQEDEDLVYKEKCEALENKILEMNMEMLKIKKERDKLKAEIPDKVAFQNMKKKLERVNQDLATAQHKLQRFSSLESFLTGFVRDAVKETFPLGSSEVAVNVQGTLTEFNVTKTREVLNATDKDVQGQILLLAAEGWFKEKKRISTIQKELHRAFNSRPRTGTVETNLGGLVAKGILDRERSSAGGWLYWLKPEAEKLINVKNHVLKTV